MPTKKLIELPADLMAAVKEAAADQGVSANAFIANVLAGAVGYREPRDRMAVLSKWGSEKHVEEVAERLGIFEAWHLEHELRMTRHPAKTRLDVLLNAGLVEIDRPARGAVTGIYRWVGPKK